MLSGTRGTGVFSTEYSVPSTRRSPLPTPHSPLPTRPRSPLLCPRLGAVRGEQYCLGFTGGLGLDPMRAVSLRSRQETGEAPAALRKFFLMKADGSESIQPAVDGRPVRGC